MSEVSQGLGVGSGTESERPFNSIFFPYHNVSDLVCDAVELLSGGSASSKPLSDSESLATSLKKLEDLLDKVYAYVDDVVVGDGQSSEGKETFDFP